MLKYLPHLSQSLLFALAGILCRVLSDLESLPLWIQTFFYLAQYPLYFCALFSFVDWFAHNNIIYFERANRARTMTPASVLAEKLAALYGDNLQAFRDAMSTQEAPGGDTVREIHYTNIAGVSVPDEWLQKFFSDAQGLALPPVRSYPEGSTDRVYAQTVSKYLVDKGAAVAASGNQPVRMKSYQLALQVIGWQ